MILGITGTNASGKGVVCSLLKELYGFTIFSLADPLREEAARRGIEPSTRNLILLGNEFREKYGAGALAHLVKSRIPHDKVVIDSIRNPAEVAELRRLPGFFLVSLDAPLTVRYEREKSRGRARAPTSFNEWKAIEEMEDAQNQLHLQVHVCMKQADYSIFNDSTSAALKEKVIALMVHLTQK